MVGTRFQNKRSNIQVKLEEDEQKEQKTQNYKKNNKFSIQKNRKNNFAQSTQIKKKSLKKLKKNNKKSLIINKDIETIENLNESEKQSDPNLPSHNDQVNNHPNYEELKQVSNDESLILNTSSEESQFFQIKLEERKEQFIQNTPNILSEQKQDQTTNNQDLPQKNRKLKRKPGRPKGSLNKILTSEEIERRKNKHSKQRGRPRKYPKLDDIIENEISTLGNEMDFKNSQYKDLAPLNIESVMIINEQKKNGTIEFIDDHKFDVLYGHLGIDEPLQIVDHKLAFFIKQETCKVTLDVFYEIEFDLTEEKTLLKNNFYRKEDIYKYQKQMLKAYIKEHKELYQEWRLLQPKQDNSQLIDDQNQDQSNKEQSNQNQVFLSDEEIKEFRLDSNQQDPIS